MAIGYRIGHRAEVADQILAAKKIDAHAGLEFDRWLAIWDGPIQYPRVIKPTLESLQDFVAKYNKRGGQALLDAYHQRLERATGPWLADTRDYKVQWRFASGLGAEHPLGNGFTFDDVIGAPLITGAAVKGLCRAAAQMLEVDAAECMALLGPEVEQGCACGDLIFYDALPLRWPQLAVDIINCHHPVFYGELFNEKGRSDACATETEDPVPVFFLAVKDARFRFRLVSRSSNQAHVTKAWQWLNEGLTLLGAGAKTAVGYGVMEEQTAPGGQRRA